MPLSGIRVIDLGRVIAGPLGPMLLGDMGADVIKVETGKGDGLRQQAPSFSPGMGGYFTTANRNKRSLHVDLRHPGGGKLLRALLHSADVVVENFRPGIFDAMGFTDEVLARDFPHLVVARLSAFGDLGPMGHRSGVDQLVQGYSGLMAITGSAETGPVRSGVAISDVLGGLCNTIGILGALMEKKASGRGQVVRTSLLEATMSMLTVQAGKYFASQQDPIAEANFRQDFFRMLANTWRRAADLGRGAVETPGKTRRPDLRAVPRRHFHGHAQGFRLLAVKGLLDR